MLRESLNKSPVEHDRSFAGWDARKARKRVVDSLCQEPGKAVRPESHGRAHAELIRRFLNSSYKTSFTISIMLFADHARRDLARLDADRLINHALLIRIVAHLNITA